MSDLQLRGPVWRFRLRLPKGLAKQPVPAWRPPDAAALVGAKGLFRTQVAFSPKAKDCPAAKLRGASEFARYGDMFATAKELRVRGRSLSRLLLCTGKIACKLLAACNALDAKDAAVVR
jgi:hypothetical protein